LLSSAARHIRLPSCSNETGNIVTEEMKVPASDPGIDTK